MAGGRSKRETEIKLRLSSAAQGRRLLKRAGFRLARRRTFEANTIFDTPSRDLFAAGSLVRLRRSGRVHTLTFKGPAVFAKHKSREELELEVADAGALGQIFARLGFRPVFRYEKFRAEYAQPGHSGLVTLDETPVGVFLELEGRPEWIDATARRFGFAEADYVTTTYAGLYFAYCRQRRRKPGDMVFARARKRVLS
ncbi:MAG: class IV adenylate cyclase [Acidobacteriota bacterium]